MGTVHAKSLDPLPMHGRDLDVHPEDFMETPDQGQDSKQEILENKDVSKVFFQVMKRAHVARQRLLRLGIFKDVEVLIDTSEGN
uniref:Uncharacterized protein n=2 Tax=Pseudocrenilabrinae TaxID=318546 RepID=A0A3Q4HNK7_NEOBR